MGPSHLAAGSTHGVEAVGHALKFGMRQTPGGNLTSCFHVPNLGGTGFSPASLRFRRFLLAASWALPLLAQSAPDPLLHGWRNPAELLSREIRDSFPQVVLV